jgi:anaerobic selenocysteine-containing dehydrogenase
VTRYRKYAERAEGVPTGFATPTRKVEVYSQLFLEHGYAPLPEYVEPAVSPLARPDLTARFPLILTGAKLPNYCLSQHRALPSLRRLAPEPDVELHPEAAAARGIREGDWVVLETPRAQIRLRARFRDSLDPGVVCSYHGWWQSCPELDRPGYDALGPEGANYNALIGTDEADPISGSVPHRPYLCEVRRL